MNSNLDLLITKKLNIYPYLYIYLFVSKFSKQLLIRDEGLTCLKIHLSSFQYEETKFHLLLISEKDALLQRCIYDLAKHQRWNFSRKQLMPRSKGRKQAGAEIVIARVIAVANAFTKSIGLGYQVMPWYRVENKTRDRDEGKFICYKCTNAIPWLLSLCTFQNNSTKIINRSLPIKLSH